MTSITKAAETVKIMQFCFSGVTSYAMESSMETADIMESNGFTQSSQIFCGSYRFRLRDCILLIITILMAAGGLLLPGARLVFMAFMSFIPIFTGERRMLNYGYTI